MQKLVLIFAVLLLILQILFAQYDNYLIDERMLAGGIEYGFPLFKHGGFWADFLILTPLLFYTTSKYTFTYKSFWGIISLVIILMVWIFIAEKYAEANFNEAYVHDKKTTIAGWIHVAYATLATWHIVLFFASSVRPKVFPVDICLVAGILTLFFIVAIVKVSGHWHFTDNAYKQLAIEIGGIWSIALLKIEFINKNRLR